MSYDPMTKKKKKLKNYKRRAYISILGSDSSKSEPIKLSVRNKKRITHKIPLPELESYPFLGYLSSIDEHIIKYPEIAKHLNLIKLVHEAGFTSEKYVLVQFFISSINSEHFLTLILKPRNMEDYDQIISLLENLKKKC